MLQNVKSASSLLHQSRIEAEQGGEDVSGLDTEQQGVEDTSLCEEEITAVTGLTQRQYQRSLSMKSHDYCCDNDDNLTDVSVET